MNGLESTRSSVWDDAEAERRSAAYADFTRKRDQSHIPLSRRAQQLVSQRALPQRTANGFPVTRWVDVPLLDETSEEGFRVASLRLRGVAGFARTTNDLGVPYGMEVYLEERTVKGDNEVIITHAALGTEAVFESDDVRLWSGIGTSVVSFSDPLTQERLGSGAPDLPPASDEALAALQLTLFMMGKAL